MPSLYGLGGTVGLLNEQSDPFKSDPFTSASLTPYGKNGTPFTAPYRGHLVGRPGASKELAILTAGGTEIPKIDVALDPRNLPFTEYCRNARIDEWGVIKIRNVLSLFTSVSPKKIELMSSNRFHIRSAARRSSHSLVVMPELFQSKRVRPFTSSWSVLPARPWTAMLSLSASTRQLQQSIVLRQIELVVVVVDLVSAMSRLSCPRRRT